MDTVPAVMAAHEKYQDLEVALQEGFIYIPVYSQYLGIHVVDPIQIDPNVTVADLTDPQNANELIYTVNGDGTYNLEGLAWAVPVTQSPNSTPEMFDRPFMGPMPGHAGIQPPHYGLHMWPFVDDPKVPRTKHNDMLFSMNSDMSEQPDWWGDFSFCHSATHWARVLPEGAAPPGFPPSLSDPGMQNFLVQQTLGSKFYRGVGGFGAASGLPPTMWGGADSAAGIGNIVVFDPPGDQGSPNDPSSTDIPNDSADDAFGNTLDDGIPEPQDSFDDVLPGLDLTTPPVLFFHRVQSGPLAGLIQLGGAEVWIPFKGEPSPPLALETQPMRRHQEHFPGQGEHWGLLLWHNFPNPDGVFDESNDLVTPVQ